MKRREFLRNLAIGVAGLYVPKTLYFDMKPRNEIVFDNNLRQVLTHLHSMQVQGQIVDWTLKQNENDLTFDVYIKQVKSIEYITLDFVAVANGQKIIS